MNPISIDVVFDLGVKMRTEVLPVSREAINFRLLSTEMALTDAKKPIILKFKSLFFIEISYFWISTMSLMVLEGKIECK